jgi:membrane associated rhomboid family serine protease
MRELIAALFQGALQPQLRRIARLAALGAVTLAFGLIALGAAALAIFLALSAPLGALGAALVIAAAAAALGGLASIPLWIKPKPPPSQIATLVELGVTIALALLLDRKAKAGDPPGGA